MQNSRFSPNTPKQVDVRPPSNHQPVHFSPQTAHKLLLEGKLPPRAIIDGGITFEPGSTPVFPKGVHVHGSLSIAWCGDGLKLDSDLTVDGMADFSMTSLAAIPPRLKVKMALDISHTNISSFPRDMQVGWKIVVGANVTKAMRERVGAFERKNAKSRRLGQSARNRRSTDPK